MEEPELFFEGMAALGETFGVEITGIKLKVYKMALGEYDDDRIRQAMGLALKTCKFFPKPVELIELIEGKKDDQAALAWEALLDTAQRVGQYQSVLFEDGRIARAVRLLGGWQTCCQWKTDELKFLRIDFIKLFGTMAGHPEPEVLDGIAAVNASAHGFCERILEPIRVPCLSNQWGRNSLTPAKI